MGYMNQSKIPIEAVILCESEFEKAWKEYSESNNIFKEANPHAFEIARLLFRAGYMNGAKFISNYIIGNIKKSSTESAPINDNNNQTQLTSSNDDSNQ
jgi:hypothetical protein